MSSNEIKSRKIFVRTGEQMSFFSLLVFKFHHNSISQLKLHYFTITPFSHYTISPHNSCTISHFRHFTIKPLKLTLSQQIVYMHLGSTILVFTFLKIIQTNFPYRTKIIQMTMKCLNFSKNTVAEKSLSSIIIWMQVGNVLRLSVVCL